MLASGLAVMGATNWGDPHRANPRRRQWRGQSGERFPHVSEGGVGRPIYAAKHKLNSCNGSWALPEQAREREKAARESRREENRWRSTKIKGALNPHSAITGRCFSRFYHSGRTN